MIPAAQNGDFAAAGEDVLAVYRRPVDPRFPVLGMDEAGKAYQDHVRPPRPAIPGHPAQIDPEYTRHGSGCLFLAVAPHLGWRTITVTPQRTHREWALFMRELVDVHFPAAARLIVVLDNLNTHRLGSLYRVFPPAEAFRLAQKLEVHFTPKHGSWLNVAELELSALQRQCLDRRIPDEATLRIEVTAWVAERNARRVTIAWHFTPEDARAKMPAI